MEGTILGIDGKSNIVAIKAVDGSRLYFPLEEWKGHVHPEIGMRVDYDSNGDSQARVVYPVGGWTASAQPATPSHTNVMKPAKTKTAATVFSLLLGGFGGHKFYLGQWGWGIVYLAFCWTYIPALVSLIETIRYVMIPEDEFQRKYAMSNGPFGFIE